MEGGALGFVSAGLDHDVDPGATLAIRQSSLKIMDKLMEQLELGNHRSQCQHLIYYNFQTELSFNSKDKDYTRHSLLDQMISSHHDVHAERPARPGV